MYDDYLYAAYFAAAMFGAAMNAKALGVSVCMCVGLAAVYPDADKAGFLFILYIPAYLLATFRD